MRLRHALGLALLLCGCNDATPTDWSYEKTDHGIVGPDDWGELPGNELCGSGREQSPIALSDATPTQLSPLAFDYHASALRMTNSGHTVKISPDPGSTLNGKQLVEIHFHAPSEHTLDGKSF